MNMSFNWPTYLIITSLLLAAELLYFKLADRFNIIDKPNQRSSHQTPTIRGGGIIFPLSIVFFSTFTRFSYPLLLGGVCLTAIVSFLDDIREVSPLARLSAHLLAVAAILWSIPVSYSEIQWWSILLLTIIALGTINMYNFMDGVNGMTAFYSCSILLPLIFTETNPGLLQMEICFGCGLAIFTWYNARKRARCFAGDIGSISAAIILLFFTAFRIAESQSLSALGFFSVYAADAGYTLVERLLKRENIFKPHRSHLYQLLCNEAGFPHISVSAAYALLQCLITLLIIFLQLHFTTVIGIGISLLLLCHYMKKRIKKI
jgi:UDP-N-acetylmuramyl pentapeptide phosphotransferase/UDP-N-acetylglucosamine-1-phosphate transferase